MNLEALHLSEKDYNILNGFVSIAPFLYPLKTSENRKVFWCFQRSEKGCIGKEWVKQLLNNKNIVIPKALKGNPIMVLNESDYNKGMKSILNDTSNFGKINMPNEQRKT